jgi:ParB family chromosome partitioning protein
MGIGNRILKSTVGLSSSMALEKQQPTDGAVAVPARTAPGQLLAVHTAMRGMQDELVELHRKLKQFDGSLPTRLLDPNHIRLTRWANRHESSFTTPAFAGLKASIELAGGNTQPILVREFEEDRFEVVFGHRRHRACKELGLPVLAVSLTTPASDLDVFLSMDRENREREDLSPFEQGTCYRAAMDGGLFPSRRRLAESIGVSHTWVCRAMLVAELPTAVVEAFQTPIEIQPKHALEIAAAIQRDPTGVLSRAERLRTSSDRLKAAQTVLHLTGSNTQSARRSPIRIGDRTVGTWLTDARGRTTITLEAGVADESTIAKIVESLASTPTGRAS